MSSIPEQFADAAKAHFEAQLQLINTLTGNVFQGVEKVVELNVNAAKTSLDNATGAAKEMSAIKDPQAMLAASAAQLQPAAESAIEYGRALTAIGTSMQAEITQAAEAKIAETRKTLAALIDEAVKNAPAGSEQTIAIMKSIVGNADAGYEQLMKNTKQAAETLQANVKTAADKISQATQSAAKPGKK